MSKNKNKKLLEKLFSDPYSGKREREREVQKKVFISLVILSFFALGLGAWHISQQLKGPFQLSDNTTLDEQSNSSESIVNDNQVIRLESLREKDTDADGLSDYDEFYVFKTSPYLADSDSDHIVDKVEIDQGTDPNCPKGQECGGAVAGTNSNSEVEDIFSELNPDDKLALPEIDINNLSAEELRSILRDSGVSEELLSQISDNELLETAKEVLSEGDLSNGDGAVPDASGDTTAITYEALQNLAPGEIRQFLVESGIPKETLDQVDDELLQQIFVDSLVQNIPEGANQ